MAVIGFIFFSPLQILLLPFNILIALKQIITALFKITEFLLRSFLFSSYLFLFVLWIIIPSLGFQSVSLHLFYNFSKMFMVTSGDISDHFKNLIVSFFSYKTYELLSCKSCSGSAGGAGQQPQYITRVCRISFCKLFLKFYLFINPVGYFKTIKYPLNKILSNGAKSSNTSMFSKMLIIVFLNFKFILAL